MIETGDTINQRIFLLYLNWSSRTSGGYPMDLQWGSASSKKENIREEIADVLIYLLMLCSDLGLNVKKIVEDKLEKNGVSGGQKIVLVNRNDFDEWMVAEALSVFGYTCLRYSPSIFLRWYLRFSWWFLRWIDEFIVPSSDKVKTAAPPYGRTAVFVFILI